MAMARLCERPGCSTPAEVAYGFDATHLVVWLDGFHAAQGARSGVLCLRHADAMIVPLGWMLDDRRELVPRLFKTEATVSPSPRRRAKRPRSDRGPEPGDVLETVQLSLEAAGVDVIIEVKSVEVKPVEPVPVEPVSVPDAVPAWTPTFDQSDDLSGLLKARGRLLSRAFNGIPPDEN